MVDELLAADVLVIGAPMYNLSIPSTLKAYIDQVVRAGRTFDPATYQGLATGKKLFVLAARGGGGMWAGRGRWKRWNFQEPYLKTIFGYIGITDVTFVNDEKTLSGDSELPGSLETARHAAHEVASHSSARSRAPKRASDGTRRRNADCAAPTSRIIMKIATLIARNLLGLMFLVFGLNGFLHFIPQPPPPAGLATQYLTVLFLSH